MRKEQIKYISTDAAATLFGVNKQTVARYCRKGEIIGCIKDNGKWLIPHDSIRPLSKQQKKTILRSLLIIKNNPKQEPNWFEARGGSQGLDLAFKYLYDHDYICEYKKKHKTGILKANKIQLTDKGIALAFSGGVESFSDISAETITAMISIVTQVASLYLQYLSIK